MSECQYDDCTRESVGKVTWDTVSSIEMGYCSEHLEQASEEIPDWIDGVEIV